MRATIIAAAILLSTQAHAIADPTADWKHTKAMPRLGAVVKASNGLIDEKRFSSPWTVQEVEGELLLVGDYRKGWVQQSQVIALDDAPDYYTQLINDRVETAWAFGKRGIARRAKGDLDAAVADFGEALRLNPNVAGYSNRGIAWLDKKEYDKAVLDFERAIHFDPSYVVAYTKRGTARFNMQDYDRAIADYERAARLEPNYPYSYSSAAWLKATASDARFRDGKQAVALATKACELSRWADAEALDALAAAYAEVGDFDLAVKYQSKAIELDQTDAELVNKSRQRLALYKDHKPYRQE